MAITRSPSRLRARLRRTRLGLRLRVVRGPASRFLFEFAMFAIKQAWACIFGALMLLMLLLSWAFYPEDAPLARYDFLFLAALAIQVFLILSGLETWEEIRVITAFHIVGTVMELFKTAAGSWTYPEAGLFRIGEVPLFSGFMYAAVGSYIARVWRILDFRFTRFAPLRLQALLAAAIYVNFFTHHWTHDVRLLLFLLAGLAYMPTLVWFRADEARRKMPLALGFLLVALFIWVAENIATFARAWTYPGQEDGWEMVSLSKLGSWYLLMIVSFVLVASIHQRRGGHAIADTETARSQSG